MSAKCLSVHTTPQAWESITEATDLRFPSKFIINRNINTLDTVGLLYFHFSCNFQTYS